MQLNYLLQLRPWLDRLVPAANLALVILIGLAAARLFWLLWPHDAVGVPVAVAAESAPAPNITVDVARIVAAQLFGVKTDQGIAAQTIIQAPETQLELTLTGIIASDNEGESRALIETGKGTELPYAIGDTITGDVKLYAIYPTRVILDRGGRVETLTLEREKLAHTGNGADQTQTGQRGATQLGADLAADLSTLRRRILQQPSLMLDYLRLQPARVGGNLVGYRIFPGPQRALFQRVGLQPGTLVTHLNGVPLTDPSQALKMLGVLAQAPRISLTVGSGGDERTISVSLE